MLDLYTYPLFRPPAEANNLIIQITYGCSYNNCSFCSMYKDKKFTIRTLEKVFQDIDRLKVNFPDTTKIFLADGDALTLGTDLLLKILQYLNNSFPNLRRISLYASAQNLLSKSVKELELLQENNLKLIYFGIETGDDTLLKKITKGVSKQEIIDSLNLASQANIKISSTIILGIGGKTYTKEHIQNTADIINKTQVTYLSTLQLGLEEDVEEEFYKNFEDFIPLNDLEVLEEQYNFIKELNPANKVIFRSNHASNALHLKGTLPKDKKRLLEELEFTQTLGESALIPKHFRGF